MTSGHGPRRARIAFSESAAKQLENITSEADIHALDRALVVISFAPDAGVPLPGDTAGPQLRQYIDDDGRGPSKSAAQCAGLRGEGYVSGAWGCGRG
ncbi:hypothetical protein ABZ770_35735 [Streptomyces sp. NPDC006654]|uniref:hypothetical protein n=1 Tax=Streptomyces sp. NPDC006654 TaxID=3156897 RepID=UPI0033C9C83A